MRTTLIQKGDSCEVQFPREVVEKACLGGELDIEVLDGAIVIRAAKSIRLGWEAAAAACHNAGDDCLKGWDNVVDDQWDVSRKECI